MLNNDAMRLYPNVLAEIRAKLIQDFGFSENDVKDVITLLNTEANAKSAFIGSYGLAAWERKLKSSTEEPSALTEEQHQLYLNYLMNTFITLQQTKQLNGSAIGAIVQMDLSKEQEVFQRSKQQSLSQSDISYCLNALFNNKESQDFAEYPGNDGEKHYVVFRVGGSGELIKIMDDIAEARKKRSETGSYVMHLIYNVKQDHWVSLDIRVDPEGNCFILCSNPKLDYVVTMADFPEQLQTKGTLQFAPNILFQPQKDSVSCGYAAIGNMLSTVRLKVPGALNADGVKLAQETGVQSRREFKDQSIDSIKNPMMEILIERAKMLKKTQKKSLIPSESQSPFIQKVSSKDFQEKCKASSQAGVFCYALQEYELSEKKIIVPVWLGELAEEKSNKSGLKVLGVMQQTSNGGNPIDVKLYLQDVQEQGRKANDCVFEANLPSLLRAIQLVNDLDHRPINVEHLPETPTFLIVRGQHYSMKQVATAIIEATNITVQNRASLSEEQRSNIMSELAKQHPQQLEELGIPKQKIQELAAAAVEPLKAAGLAAEPTVREKQQKVAAAESKKEEPPKPTEESKAAEKAEEERLPQQKREEEEKKQQKAAEQQEREEVERKKKAAEEQQEKEEEQRQREKEKEERKKKEAQEKRQKELSEREVQEPVRVVRIAGEGARKSAVEPPEQKVEKVSVYGGKKEATQMQQPSGSRAATNRS